ncbi:flagellar biosynthesis protein FlhA [Rubricella aquisinus]|uniref:Flagellar biosynthesis protein FlhA n=1 Tax=Rubricella aquisinus TaxID=2028108 RepID=A0A840WVM3_9RHOB|nr:flagellar biosynthesis protein FlhA [Rubricella aquisinus]MBB5515240.1 flagellar biosynthesis protein FlhA [Rubricella aquisinus]
MNSFTIRDLYQPTILLAVALIAVIVMMVLPMPSWVLDLGLAASFAIAILIFTTTLFIERPLDFSSFPTILLASLMLRLSLNVSSTKLIIGEGHTGTAAAGGVIEGFAMFVMGGSVFLGLVVFGVLMIVNFIVITKGAGRMAEVGARFALDAMPGKQLAIDSDVAAGAITHAEARARRDTEQEETTFFGSLDGASKFVKGDAVAGLLITFLNLLMGVAMGLFVHDLPAGQAFETYAILTVGDGLVTQIPAVIISIATALLLSKGREKGAADQALLRQLGGYPVALGTVAVLLALFGLVPGLPLGPFLAGAVVLGIAAYLSQRVVLTPDPVTEDEADDAPSANAIGDILDLDDIHVEFSPDLVPVVMDATFGLDRRIANMRRHVAQKYGLVLPEIRLTDDATLPDKTYIIRLHGVEAARDQVHPGRAMVLLPAEPVGLPDGIDVAEPVYGAPARWIDDTAQEDAALLGVPVVSPAEVVATHMLEVIKDNLGRLLTRRAMRRLLDEFVLPTDPARARANQRLLDEFIPDKLPVDRLQSVLRLLLEERVSIRNLPLILEATAEAAASGASIERMAEHVRQRLGFQLISDLKEPDGAIPLIQISPDWETIFATHEAPSDTGAPDVALPPAEFNRFAKSVSEQIGQASARGRNPGILTSAHRRRFISAVLSAKGVRNPVLSFEEVGSHAKPALLGTA